MRVRARQRAAAGGLIPQDMWTGGQVDDRWWMMVGGWLRIHHCLGDDGCPGCPMAAPAARWLPRPCKARTVEQSQ